MRTLPLRAALILVLAMTAMTTVTASAFADDVEDRQRMYMNFLRGEGYLPAVTPNGDIRFKHEGGTYLIIIYENDPKYFQILFPNIWSIENADERRKVEAATNYATRMSKVAKVYTNSNVDNVNASVELFVNDPADFEALFGRSMKSVQNSVSNFVKKMRE